MDLLTSAEKHLSRPTCKVLYAVMDNADILCLKDIPLAHGHITAHQDFRVLLSKAAFKPVAPSIYGAWDYSSQGEDLTFPFF